MKSLTIALAFCLISHALFGQDAVTQKARTPFILGVIDEIQSTELAEKRILNIYLPEGYKEQDTTRYPVIYLLDGSADEDFIHVAGLVQYSNFPWVNILPKSIVVGIANVDRRRDFTFPTTVKKDKADFPTTGGSAKFIAFIEHELQPFIEKSYRVNATKTIIGQSFGGLLATEILFKKPGLFSRYIIISPSLWWGKEALLLAEPLVLKPDFVRPTSIYIAVGNEEKVMVEDTRKLTGIIKKGNRRNLQVSFQYFEKENHATIMHQAVYNAFEKFNQPKTQ
jgi:predicted alpha/beta superfamily hydrolase